LGAASAVLGGTPELIEDLALQGEHLVLLSVLGVVVTQQVEHPVHGKQVQFVEHRVTRCGGLPGRDLRTQHDVTE
jgi:hypothetical protein